MYLRKSKKPNGRTYLTIVQGYRDEDGKNRVRTVKSRGYVDALEDSFVMKDMRQFKNVPNFMEHFDRMFCGYPEMIRDMMNTMFVVDGSPVQPMKKSMMPIVKGVGFMNLFKDVKGAMKAL